MRNGDTVRFQIKSGVRQGGVIPPLLFVIFMDICIKDTVRNDEMILAFAEDIAVVCDSEELTVNGRKTE